MFASKVIIAIALAAAGIASPTPSPAPDYNTTDAAISTLQQPACVWEGTAPLCEGACRDGWTEMTRTRCGDGSCCFTGFKVFCCKI